MSDHSLYGKQKLCYTEVTDFTDFQGIGRDPMYKRFDSVYSVINKSIPEQFRDFLAHPIYSADDDQIQWYVKDWKETPTRYNQLSGEELARFRSIKEQTIKVFSDATSSLTGEDRQIMKGALKYVDDDFIFCYDDKVVVVAWGMVPDTSRHIVKGTVIHDIKVENRRRIRFDAGEHGSLKTKLDGILNREDGAALSHLDIPTVIPNPGFEFKCWDVDPLGIRITKDIVFHALYNELPQEETPSVEAEKVRVEFVSDPRGSIVGESVLFIEKGMVLSASQIPAVQPNAGVTFEGWDTATDLPIDHDVVINAVFSEKSVHCRFEAGTYGSLSGTSSFIFPYGSSFRKEDIPVVTPKKGYKFIGWDTPPEDYILNEDTVFSAQYEKEKKVPWFKRFWAWLTGKGCLKWLLWLLVALLLLFLLSQLLRGCGGGILGGAIGHDKALPIGQIETPDGRIIDNNGPIKGIVGDDGQLPEESIVAPIVGDDGKTPPIVERPGTPDVVGDRLNIYFEDDNVDLNQFSSDLNDVFSSECEIVGVDHNVPMLQIRVPAEERDRIRKTLPSSLPEYRFFVVDESIFSIVGHISNDNDDPGWHLRAINLKEGWKYTKGSENVVVAVVDDGIDSRHEILRGRFYKPYNVFTQDNHLSTGEGHGTHVAGLAVGSDKFFEKGVSGVAPKCLLMPVQVFDNGVCTFSSVTSGIMYAIHNGASIVNVSIGPNFRGMDILPIPDQELIARTQFKNEEKVWRRIINVANKNNVIIVFAAGNDNIIACIPPENRTNSTVNVAAIARNFKETDFTNYGAGSNVSAPGKGILSSVPTNQYAVFDGTSMAAPIVSGTVALMKSIKPEVAITDILTILQHSGRTISENVPPMVQVDKALEMLKTGIPPIEPPREPSSGVSDDRGQKSPVNDDGNIIPGDAGVVDDPTTENPDATPGAILPGHDAGHVSDDPGMGEAIPGKNDGTDFDAIRKMIEFYKKKIKELEKLLPENDK